MSGSAIPPARIRSTSRRRFPEPTACRRGHPMGSASRSIRTAMVAAFYTMNALGGDVRRVIPIKPGVLYTFSLAWSRDNSLVYTNFHDEGKKDVFRIAPSGAPASCLTCGLSSERGARSGELSPSGELLLYKTGEMGARGALQILHLASRRVVHVFDQVDGPRWSADSSRGRTAHPTSGRLRSIPRQGIRRVSPSA